MDPQISHIAGISNVKRCAPLANEFVKSFASKNNWGAARAKVICASIARLYSRQMYAHTDTHAYMHNYLWTRTQYKLSDHFCNRKSEKLEKPNKPTTRKTTTTKATTTSLPFTVYGFLEVVKG